jgi:hypothetical protein
MKKCSTSLTIKKMHIKTLLRFHCTPVRVAIIKKTNNSTCWLGCPGRGKGRKKLSYGVGENLNLCSHCGNQYGGSSKNLKYNYYMI